MKYFTKIPIKKEYKSSFKAKIVFIGENSNKEVLKKLSNVLFNDITLYEIALKSKLRELGILLIFPVYYLQHSKQYRIEDIRKLYGNIKKKFDVNSKIILLHDYVDEAIGSSLREEYDEVYTISYLQTFEKFRKKLLSQIPKKICI